MPKVQASVVKPYSFAQFPVAKEKYMSHVKKQNGWRNIEVWQGEIK